jgi:hypothetical protein
VVPLQRRRSSTARRLQVLQDRKALPDPLDLLDLRVKVYLVQRDLLVPKDRADLLVLLDLKVQPDLKDQLALKAQQATRVKPASRAKRDCPDLLVRKVLRVLLDQRVKQER